MLRKRFAALPSGLLGGVDKSAYDRICDKHAALCIKRVLDIALAAVLLPPALIVMAGVALAVWVDEPGKILFCQTRVKQYGRRFTIYKFRTMHQSISGELITGAEDKRVTRVGRYLRRTRLDELPQLFNVLKGDLSFVGPRPEVPEFVQFYDQKMRETLLIPAGITGPASLAFREEEKLLQGGDTERIYRELILPRKMKINLDYMETFSLRADIRILLRTVLVTGKLRGAESRKIKPKRRVSSNQKLGQGYAGRAI